jgi:hypothetical protein
MVELSRGTDVFHAQQVENSRWISEGKAIKDALRGK